MKEKVYGGRAEHRRKRLDYIYTYSSHGEHM